MKKTPPRSRRKRPTATLDLKAKEVKKSSSGKDSDQSAQNKAKSNEGSAQKSVSNAKSTPPQTGSEKSPTCKATASKSPASRTTDTGQNKSAGKTAASGSRANKDAASNSPTPAPPVQKSGGGFMSHLFASVIGAGLGIFGLSYANNNNMMPAGFELSGGKEFKQKISSLSAKVGQMERAISPNDPNGLTARLSDLATRLSQTESSLGYGREGAPTLADKVTKLEATFNELEQAARSGKGGKLARLTSVSKQLKKSNKQALALKTELIKVREEQNTFREDLSGLRSKQADFVSTTAKISDDLARIKNANAQMVANANRPPDVSAQISPVMSSLAALTAKIDGVMHREASSKAEGRDIALALSLGELKRAVNEGTPYEAELARVVPHAPKGLDLTVLSQYAPHGLITTAKLRKTFSDYSTKALASEHVASSGSFVDQMMANAKSLVQVRPTGLVKGEGTGAILSRIEYRLGRNDLGGVLEESKALQGPAKKVMQPWLKQAGSRFAGSRVLRALEDKIRNALGGAVSSKG
ncbi:MAG: hypothetical protein L3J67_02210 [Hyphomicrobiaceae bacterium]|nr:hypothetical protein [Hyphomicrobiaceae bacterium]